MKIRNFLDFKMFWTFAYTGIRPLGLSTATLWEAIIEKGEGIVVASSLSSKFTQMFAYHNLVNLPFLMPDPVFEIASFCQDECFLPIHLVWILFSIYYYY